MNHIQMLKEEFVERKLRRPHYSERAFARDLKVSSGYINLLFNGKRSLSPKKSLDILEKLNWDEVKQKKFLHSVHKSVFKKDDRKPNLKHQETIEMQELKLDQFRLMSNINHFVIIELIQTHSKVSFKKILDYTGLDKNECEVIVERLVRLGFVKKSGIFFSSSRENRKIKDTPSQAIRNFHKQAIEMASKAIDFQSLDEKEFRALTLSVGSSELPEAKRMIQRFVNRFNDRFGNTSNGLIYQLNVQLYKHGKIEEPNEKGI